MEFQNQEEDTARKAEKAATRNTKRLQKTVEAAVERARIDAKKADQQAKKAKKPQPMMTSKQPRKASS